MARPKKEGLGYYALSVDFYEDERIDDLTREFPGIAEAIITRLLCMIYRHGAYIEYDDEIEKYLSIKVQTSTEKVRAIINRATECDYFDNTLYKKDNVLTSVEIQEYYLTAKKKWQYSYIPEEYCLIKEDVPEDRDEAEKETATDTETETVIEMENSDEFETDLFGEKIEEKPKIVLSGFSIILNDKSYYDIPMEDLELYKTTFPAVDVEQELREMGSWAQANPRRRKTIRGIKQFIHQWLSKQQDKPTRQDSAQNRINRIPTFERKVIGEPTDSDIPF